MESIKEITCKFYHNWSVKFIGDKFVWFKDNEPMQPARLDHLERALRHPEYWGYPDATKVKTIIYYMKMLNHK